MIITIPPSSRLTYRLMDANDKLELFELDQDPEVMRYINGRTTSLREIEDVYVPRLLSYRNPEKGWGIWRVATKQDDEFLGWILIRPMHFFSDSPEYHNIEIGWRFKRKHWDQGYATEAAKAVLKQIDTHPEVTQISAIAQEENSASINIMRKLGMQFEKKALHKNPLGDSMVVYYQMPIAEE